MRTVSKPWAKAHSACVAYGTTEVRHKGHGYCVRCHFSWRYRNDPELKASMLERAKRQYSQDPDKCIERSRKSRLSDKKRASEWRKNHAQKLKRVTGASKSAKYCAGMEVEAYGMRFRVTGKAVFIKKRWHVPAINLLSLEPVMVETSTITWLGLKPSLWEAA